MTISWIRVYQVLESGLFDLWDRTSYNYRLKKSFLNSKFDYAIENSSIEFLSLSHITFAFYILGFFMSLSIIAFFIEMFISKLDNIKCIFTNQINWSKQIDVFKMNLLIFYVKCYYQIKNVYKLQFALCKSRYLIDV